MSLLFEGRRIDFQPGDTIASALLRAGVTTFSRGPKYHRPRGPFCLNDTCAQCHMRVAGEPNVATCIAPASDDIEVERQNVVGTGDTDLLRAVDFLYPQGLDHHHLMTRFKLLGSATQAVARRLAGVGRIPTQDLPRPRVSQREADVVVVGAGASGLAAAAKLVGSGVCPLVLEARETTGGWAACGFGARPPAAETGEVLRSTRVLSLYPEGQGACLIARGSETLWQIHAKQIVIATGGIERPMLFEGNDLPGVFAGRAFSRLAQPPGKKAVVVAAHPDAFIVAERLARKGIEIVALVDTLNSNPTAAFSIVRGAPVRATGRSGVAGLTVRTSAGAESLVKCDLVLTVSPLAPAFELAAEVGVDTELGAEGFRLVTDETGATALPWLHACGRVTGHRASSESTAAAAYFRIAGRS